MNARGQAAARGARTACRCKIGARLPQLGCGGQRKAKARVVAPMPQEDGHDERKNALVD
jgi:hypothetical protein